jgi:hypothetical protein
MFLGRRHIGKIPSTFFMYDTFTGVCGSYLAGICNRRKWED